MNDNRGRILVVDDRKNMRSLLEHILAESHDVTTCADGREALERLAQESFDVVLTDVRMPGIDGFEVVRSIKAKWPATEVVMITAYASIESAVRAVKEGAYDYVQKPFDPDDVALVVARALENKRQRAGLDLSDAPADATGLPYRDAVALAHENASRDYLRRLLTDLDGNVTHAAQRAGLERESLHRLLRRHGLQAEDFRSLKKRPV